MTLKENNGNTTSYTYGWTTGSGEGASIISGQNSTEVKASWPNAGTGHLTLMVVNNNTQCISRKTVAITVNAVPNPTISANDEVCQNSTDFPTAITLTASPNNLSSYVWAYDGGTATAGDGDYQKKVSWTAVGNHTVSVKVTDDKNCSARTTHTVMVNALPILSVSTTSVQCNGGNDGTITATATNGAEPYSYTLDGSTSSTTGEFTGLTASIAPHHTVVVTDNKGCQAQKTGVAIEQSAGFALVIDTVYKTNCTGTNGIVNAHVESEGTGYFDIAVYDQNDVIVGTVAHHRAGETFVKENLPIGSYTLKVNADNDLTCNATKQFEVKLNDTLKIIEIPAISPLCSGSDSSGEQSESDT